MGLDMLLDDLKQLAEPLLELQAYQKRLINLLI